MKHASFFSGVGGLDLGLERAGIQTVSVCEIDPYASSVLAERFPSAPNLGSITEVNANDIPEADIWSGGFPCQDLSVAGKRAGFAGKRSSLAFTFLDLVEQRRPRWIVLENVPGLLSSNEGRDFGRLLGEMDGLGYGVAWRTLDARYFGVAQRRRRVFVVGSLGADRAAEVLFECESCERHPTPSPQAGQAASSKLGGRAHVAGAITGRFGKGVNSTIDEPLIISPTPHPDGMRAPDGMAGRLDDQPQVARKGGFGQYEMTDAAGTLRASGGDLGGGSENLAVAATLTAPTGGGRRDTLPLTLIADTTISFPSAYSRQPTHFNNVADPLTINAGPPAVLQGEATQGGAATDYDLPLGLDSHRYRCCGNGVVAPVAEWIGRRITHVDRLWREEGL